jgi:microcystin-dependent protein
LIKRNLTVVADYYTGQIAYTSASFAAYGLLPCDGRVYRRGDYENLYMVIGNRFGGSAAEGTFAVPNLGPSPPFACPREAGHYAICWDGELPVLGQYEL